MCRLRPHLEGGHRSRELRVRRSSMVGDPEARVARAMVADWRGATAARMSASRVARLRCRRLQWALRVGGGGVDDGAFQSSLDGLWGSRPDDTGGATAARYRFQAEVIAREAIVCLASGRGAVVCEWQEDAIIVRADGVELLSVKHLEVSQGRWTRHQLVISGGLRHLYERWSATGRRARCRLATNGGLDADARRLRDACASGSEESIADVARDVCGSMGATVDDILPFLRVLRVEDELPARRHIGAVNVVKIMRPALRKLGYTSLSADDAYEAIVRAVEIASRDRPETSDALDVVLDPTRLDELTSTRRRLADRTLRPDTLRVAVSGARGSDRVRLVMGSGPTATALEQKLRAGGLGMTTVQAAKALRATWSLFEREMLDPLAGPGDLDDFAVRLIESAGEAELAAMAARDVDGTWGRLMHQLIRDRIAAGSVVVPPFVPKQDELIVGYIYELTDRCHIWWSEPFELERAS